MPSYSATADHPANWATSLQPSRSSASVATRMTSGKLRQQRSFASRKAPRRVANYMSPLVNKPSLLKLSDLNVLPDTNFRTSSTDVTTLARARDGLKPGRVALEPKRRLLSKQISRKPFEFWAGRPSLPSESSQCAPADARHRLAANEHVARYRRALDEQPVAVIPNKSTSSDTAVIDAMFGRLGLGERAM